MCWGGSDRTWKCERSRDIMSTRQAGRALPLHMRQCAKTILQTEVRLSVKQTLKREWLSCDSHVLPHVNGHMGYM